MSVVDPRRFLLDEQISREIFFGEIVPQELEGPSSVAEPLAVFVGGQPGAGKTRTTESVVEGLIRLGDSVVVNSDFYKPFHPMYDELLETDDTTAAPYTSLDGRRWMAMAEAWLIEHRQNAIVETTMRDAGDFAVPAAAFRGAGYRTELAVLAVPEAQSRLGIVSRYEEQVTGMGHGRLTEVSNHDASYSGVLAAVADVDERRLVDAVVVYRRGGIALYVNALTDAGVWQESPGAAGIVSEERSRSWTLTEARAFSKEVRRLRDVPNAEWLKQLDAIESLADAHLPAGGRERITASSVLIDLLEARAREPHDNTSSSGGRGI